MSLSGHESRFAADCSLAQLCAPILWLGKSINFNGLNLKLTQYRWKSIFGAGQQINKGWINDVTERESNLIKDYCKGNLRTHYDENTTNIGSVLELIAQNHDLQVRFKWNKNDVAIWDKYGLPTPLNLIIYWLLSQVVPCFTRPRSKPFPYRTGGCS